ncbi:hypothetical protein SAMN05444679_14010 [Variovorax sp. CF079]|uniref:tRNA-binding protein n=1 Tax=Variovorax sp. CF079 TaxID=1882774 RepID=UPI000886EB3F|nr:tRNA-binding protein [Variovorax sp. CF079]SDE93082.1 hypothetical protein SAMN05444679_14010 [Variovorax sp. CF079]
MTTDPTAFERLDLRVGRIVDANPNLKARVPAFKLYIDFGDLGMRTSSGQYMDIYTAEELIGRQVICAMNLGSIRIGGFDRRCSCSAHAARRALQCCSRPNATCHSARRFFDSPTSELP